MRCPLSTPLIEHPSFRAQARVRSLGEAQARHRLSLAEPDAFWLAEAAHLRWLRAPTQGQHRMGPGEFAWFADGQLNLTHSCIDRHAEATPHKTALLWVRNEPGVAEPISFLELQRAVGQMANTLRGLGVRKGDRVCLYLPMIPALPVAMLACARIGAVHSVVFAGFSADALRDRILDAGARVVITADEGIRGNKHVPLKRIVDEALRGAPIVQSVLVARRTGAAVPMTPGRDQPLDEALSAHRAWCPAEVMEAEDPLFILYTSGSTGKPKGLVHSTGGYLTYAASTHREVFDLRPDDVHFCAADLGWITGHSYILYGPLANGTTSVLFEGIPTWPDPSRLWQVVDQVGATTLYTSPTALRTLIREGDQHLASSSRASLRLLGTVGEPINPDVWRWYHDQVGQGRCPVVDTWWQTETGGVQISPIPGATPLLPGSATLPLPGVEPLLVSPEGAILEGNEVSGLLCLRGPTPGFARTIWGDHRRYLQTYWLPQHGLYLTGDGARRDAHGYIWITGRVDDVINVSGHRLGTAEVESALVAHPSVAEAAVVPCPHDIKGQGIFAYVVLVEGEHRDPAELVGALKEAVRKAIGPIATPDHIILAPGLPKTRSGKLMRRILRKLAEGETESLGDLSTLADPEVVTALIGLVRG